MAAIHLFDQSLIFKKQRMIEQYEKMTKQAQDQFTELQKQTEKFKQAGFIEGMTCAMTAFTEVANVHPGFHEGELRGDMIMDSKNMREWIKTTFAIYNQNFTNSPLTFEAADVRILVK